MSFSSAVEPWVRALREQDVHALTARERADRLGGLRRVIDALEVEFSRTLAASDALGDAELLDGARSTASWLRDTLRLAPGDAAERVRVARSSFSGDAPTAVAADAVAAGQLTYDQLRAITGGTRDLEGEPARRAADLLTGLGRQVDAQAIRVAARHLRCVVDPDGAQRSFAEKFDARRASFAPLLDGMYRMELLADPEGATVLDAGLSALMAPNGVDDHRTPPQRRYDAVISIFRRALGDGTLPTVGGSPPQLLVHCTPEALAGATDSLPGALPDGSPLPRPTLDRIACDCAINRIVFGPSGEVLEHGRTRRLFTGAQKRALWARDGGCRFPGCGAPWTQAHHVVPWQAGGRTDLANALSVCEVHHHRLHEDGWRVQLTDAAAGTNAAVSWVDPSGECRVTRAPGLDRPVPLRVLRDPGLVGARAP